MNAPKLLSVRLSAVNDGELTTSDDVVLELPASNKFSVSWPSGSRTMTVSASQTSERANPGFSESESETSEEEPNNEQKDSSDRPRDKSSMTTHYRPAKPRSPNIPRFSRAFSMPLPSQLGYLKHPHKSGSTSSPEEPSSEPVTPDPSRLQELSVELADSVQMMIQTMLQVSPPQLLDPAKEQFSACSLSVPTSSMSAMLTSMKNLNYISANMSGLCSELSHPSKDDHEPRPSSVPPPVYVDFDIGEMLQSVGDALSGAAAHVGVDLVLYHGDDIGMRHVCVRGDESGISYALSHVIRQVLTTAQAGDSIELGLLIRPLDSKTGSQAPSQDDEYSVLSPSTDTEEPFSCTIRISHKYGNGRIPTATSNTTGSTDGPIRSQPTFSTLLLQRLLRQVGVTLTPNLPRSECFKDGCTYDFTLILERGSLSMTNTPVANDLADESSREPSVEQLTLFAEGLKGKRVTLYANAKGSFAQHLTSYLTAWGMDVTHVSPEGEVDGLVGVPPSPTMPVPPPPGPLPMYSSPTETLPSESPFKDNIHARTLPPSFIFIDDDIEVLKERLHTLRPERPYQLNLNLRKRPSLASHHRPRSSSQIARITPSMQFLSQTPVVLVHFTSLSNYKIIKDIVQSVMASHAGSATPLPEVMIIPKPAGPRRFLTALHTAVTKPVVDPFFTPIATSPMSPSVHPSGSFFHSYHNQDNTPRHSPKMSRPSGSRSNSDRSTKSIRDLTDLSTHPHPPSPLSVSDNVEYFSEAATKLGASPSSGLVIQSPDGQPAGIFFHPRGKSQRNPSSQSMERDKGQLTVSPESRRRSSSRLSIGTDCTSPMSFSSLHAVAIPAGASASQKPAVEAWMASSPGMRAVRKPNSPRPDEPSSPQAPSTSAPRRPSMTDETARKPTPPSSPLLDNASPITRRPNPRRPTQENHTSPSAALAAASKRAKAVADGNIVPPISVLIVDDNPINQTILSTFMKKKKIKYDLASNGQEAVQKWRTGGFHLILMDIQMPIMDGIQATKEIRRLEQSNAAAGYPPTTPSDDQRASPLRTPSDTSTDTKSTSSPYRSSVIIVALTASSLQSDRVAALAAGCNDFLTKPVSLLWLNNKIIEWGSIKALQMWADLRPEALNNLSTEQAVQARNVAERLHVPKGRSTPSPSRDANTSTPRASQSQPSPGGGSNGNPLSVLANVPNNNMAAGPPTSSTFWSPDRSSPSLFWGHLDGPSSPPSAKTLNEFAKDLAQGGRRGTSTIQPSLATVASVMQDSKFIPQALKPGVSEDGGHPVIASRPDGDESPR